MLSFEWLIDPIAPAAFFRDYYERKFLLIEGSDPSKFQCILSVDAVDRYLATSTPCFPGVFLVDAARELKPEEYSFPNGNPPGKIDLPRAYQLFQSGATVSLSQMHNQLPGLAALCRAVEKLTSHPFQTNIYLTPPNAQGFKTHYDTHDVFVLQVSGSKRWSLYETPVELPLHGQHFDSEKHNAGPVTREFTLHAGDLLYCPRGLCHSARSTDEASLHITLGLIGRTWADVMIEAVTEACLASPAFRANLPIGFANAGFDRSQAVATFRTLVDAFARDAEVDSVLERFAEDFVASRRPSLTGCLRELADAPQVAPGSKVVARPDVIYRLQEEDERLVIVFGSVRITLPLHTREAVEAALGGAPFVVRNLPGTLDDAGKVVLVRRLIKEGLLTRVDDDAATAPHGVDAERADGPAKQRVLERGAPFHA
jgi:mannose-6-phosphate isomerase-like protein (cupin superfamily)